MRDIIVCLLVFGSIPLILKASSIGAYVWAWLSVMNPHKMAYGFAQNLPFAQVTAIFTLLSLFTSKDRKRSPMTSITSILLLFMVWMTITSAFALGPTERVWDRWLFVFKIHLMLLVTVAVVINRTQIMRLIWVLVFSLGFFGVKGGLYTLATGGSGRVWGPPGGTVYGNNEFALALVTLVPLMYFLLGELHKKWHRTAMWAAMGLCILSILGSQSRGAFLALVAMGFFLGMKSKRKALTLTLMTIALVGGGMFMADSWKKRMETIQTYEQDDSAMSRIYQYKMVLNLASARPVLGAGFGLDNRALYSMYSDTPGRVYVVHSIYFQALGEQGYVGLFIYLLLGIVTWRTAGRLARSAQVDLELAWVNRLMRMCQVSLMGFAIGGAFLALVHWDYPYYIAGLVAIVDLYMRDRKRIDEDEKASKSAKSEADEGYLSGTVAR